MFLMYFVYKILKQELLISQIQNAVKRQITFTRYLVENKLTTVCRAMLFDWCISVNTAVSELAVTAIIRKKPRVA